MAFHAKKGIGAFRPGDVANLAINPLPWFIARDLTWHLNYQTLATALSELRSAGFSAVQADIPDGSTVAEYNSFLTGADFRPAPGYFSGDFSHRENHRQLVEGVKRHAAQQAELGLDVAFIAQDSVAPRLKLPAVGVGFNAETLFVIAEGLASAADAAKRLGVRYALHPHVSTLVETEQEVRLVLDSTTGSALAFGPDTGHLAWAGMDPQRIIRDYSDRVAAVHLKDVDESARARAVNESANYVAATSDLHVWTEPGRGMIDFGAVFDGLPNDFDGWFVIEVDVPNLPTAQESAKASLDFINSQPYFMRADA
jgi:inosose dehydratase